MSENLQMFWRLTKRRQRREKAEFFLACVPLCILAATFVSPFRLAPVTLPGTFIAALIVGAVVQWLRAKSWDEEIEFDRLKRRAAEREQKARLEAAWRTTKHRKKKEE